MLLGDYLNINFGILELNVPLIVHLILLLIGLVIIVYGFKYYIYKTIENIRYIFKSDDVSNINNVVKEINKARDDAVNNMLDRLQTTTSKEQVAIDTLTRLSKEYGDSILPGLDIVNKKPTYKDIKSVEDKKYNITKDNK